MMIIGNSAERGRCKFCGGDLNGRGEWRACTTCGKYCMTKCAGAGDGRTWHKGPCISCAHNPYQIRHKWNGKEWVLRKEQEAETWTT